MKGALALFSLYRNLGPVDFKLVRRDSLLGWALLTPLFLALGYRFGIPPLAELLNERLQFDLMAYQPLLMSFYVMTAPLMVGMVVGFLLLDERDECMLAAVLVTPVPLGMYLTYRLSLPLFLGFTATLIGYPMAAMAPLPSDQLVLLCLLASLNGPVTAFFLAGFAENKVSGFAMVKVLNTINIVPVFAYFWPSIWQITAGAVPSYWSMKVLWLMEAGGDYRFYWLAGFFYQALILALLLARFHKVAHR